MAAISYLAKGTKAEANNAAVTPALPTWTEAAGDWVLALGFIRENGATLAITTGWTLINSYQSPTAEVTIYLWKKDWASGMTAPTITPSGGGSGDAVIGQCLAMRGAVNSISVHRAGTTGNDAAPNADVSYNATSFTSQNGDVSLIVSGFSNDATTTASYFRSYNPSSAIPNWTSVDYAATTQGSDGTLGWQFAGWDLATSGVSNSYLYGYISCSPNATPCWMWITFHGDAIPPPPAANMQWLIEFNPNLEYISSSGVKADVKWLIEFNPNLVKVDAVHTHAYGFSTAWDMEGLPAAYTGGGWRVKTYINGVETPVSQITLRRFGTTMKIQAMMPGYTEHPVGATLALDIQYVSTTGQATVVQISECPIVLCRPSTRQTEVNAECENQTVKGIQWEPGRILYAATMRLRTEVDWYVRPGDTYDGRIITDVVTTLGVTSQWFTEVGYG